MNQKKIIREKILLMRRKLSKEEAKEKSTRIISNLKSLEEFKNAKNILFYVSFNNEPDTIELIKEILKTRKKRIIVPYTINKVINISELNDFSVLKKAYYGALEPKKESIIPFSKKDINLIIMPGVAFDHIGNRIGFGKGCYDKFLKNTKFPRIALAYEFQVLKKVPADSHDEPVDKIITESGVTYCVKNTPI